MFRNMLPPALLLSALCFSPSIAAEENELTFIPVAHRLAEIGAPMTVGGTLSSPEGVSLHGLTVTLTVGDDVYVSELPDFEVEDNASFELATGYVPGAEGEFDYSLAFDCGGRHVTCSGSRLAARRRVVAEEGTGTWCGYCIRGIYAFESMEEKYPDDFIGIAIHVDDVMATDSYPFSYAMKSNSGLPHVVVNREIEGDPSSISVFFNRIKRRPFDVALDFSMLGIEDDMLTVTSSVTFDADYGGKDYRLAYCIVENDVCHPDDPLYCQHNNYSGNDVDMGGFEDMPPLIAPSEMHYMHVARHFFTDADGIAGSLPPSASASDHLTHTASFPLPSNIDNPDNARLVGMLIDASDGRILNACSAPLPAPGAGVGETLDFSGLRVTPGADGLVTVTSSAPVLECRLYTLAGSLAATSCGSSSSCTLRVSAPGCYILVIDTPSGRTSRRLLL